MTIHDRDHTHMATEQPSDHTHMVTEQEGELGVSGSEHPGEGPGGPEKRPRYRRQIGDHLRPADNAPTKRPSARAPAAHAGHTIQAPSPFAPGNSLASIAPAVPWERQPRENDREWCLFLAYRDSLYPAGLGGAREPRNIARLARDLGEPAQSLYELARTFSWVWRAAHYDRDVDRRQQSLARSEQERVAVEHERLRGKARQLAELELDKLLQLAVTQPDQLAISPRELIRLVEMVFLQDRLATGEATAHVKVSRAGRMDLAKLNYEQLLQLREIQKIAGGAITTTGEPA